MEIDKCKKSIESIKGQIYEAQKKFIDYNRLRFVYDVLFAPSWLLI